MSDESPGATLRCKLTGHVWSEGPVENIDGFLKTREVECRRCGVAEEVVYMERSEDRFGIWYQ